VEKNRTHGPRPETRPLPATPEITSRELLGTRRELTILHDGQRYVLRVTANNKLILTK
jgi:hemin uptake protein HemP